MKKVFLLLSLLTASASSFAMEQPTSSEQIDPGYAIGLCLFEQEVNKSIEKAESFYEASRLVTWWHHSFCPSTQIFFKDKNFIRSLKEKLLTKFTPTNRYFNFEASEAFSEHINFVDFNTHDRAISSLPEGWRNPSSNDYKRMKEIFTQNYTKIIEGGRLDYLDYEFDRSILHTGDTIKVIRDDQQNIMGFITFRTFNPTILTTHVELLTVDNQHQKKGYGKRLIEYVAQLAKAYELRELQLRAHHEAVGFYEKIGFTEYKYAREPREYVKNII